MKDKRYKYVEDVIEDYIALLDEQIEIPLLISKAQEKFESYNAEQVGNILKPAEAENYFKIFMQIKKAEERNNEISVEIKECEDLLREFIQFANGSKISYEKKDDNKNKITYLFWLEDDMIKCNR